jgi:amidase
VRALSLALLAALLSPALAAQPASIDAPLIELPLVTLQARLASGMLSAEAVTAAFLERIAAVDDSGPALNAIIAINPDAVDIARALDRRFARDGIVGPLHGIPVILKANIDTADRMVTSAGSLAMAGHYAAADAAVVERLRNAGAVILAKANLSEWANFRSTRSTSGWSSLGGQTRNPYVLDRSPCGSSSGSAAAVAARLAPLAIGTETDGSIVCPAGVNGVVGIKPTVGSVSRRGIVPLAASQDTAGPMARTVRDASLLLAVISERALPADADSAVRRDLRGLRLGVVRDYSGAGGSAAVDSALARALALLDEAGAQLIDPIMVRAGERVRAAELELLLYEFKAGLNAYLAGNEAAPASLAALIEFNAEHASTLMPHFGQELFVAAESKGGLDDDEYRAAVAGSTDHMRSVLEALFAEHDLDALVAPVNDRAWRIDWRNGDAFGVDSASTAAISGYPSIAVPAAMAGELPIGIAFIGEPYREPLLIDMAGVFERVRGPFPAPRFLESVPD